MSGLFLGNLTLSNSNTNQGCYLGKVNISNLNASSNQVLFTSDGASISGSPNLTFDSSSLSVPNININAINDSPYPPMVQNPIGILPAMTSNNFDGYTASGSSTYPGYGNYYEPTNGGLWVSNGNSLPVYWQMQLPTAKALWQVQAFARHDGSDERLVNFLVQGSNDGTTWVTVGSETGFPSDALVYIPITDPTYTPYSYYRYYTDNPGDIYGTNLGFSNIQFYEWVSLGGAMRPVLYYNGNPTPASLQSNINLLTSSTITNTVSGKNDYITCNFSFTVTTPGTQITLTFTFGNTVSINFYVGVNTRTSISLIGNLISTGPNTLSIDLSASSPILNVDANDYINVQMTEQS